MLVEAVFADSLKHRKVDTGAEILTGALKYDGTYGSIVSQRLARFDERFDHGKINSIVFFRPVEGNLGNMISNFDCNSVTHSLLPQRHPNPGQEFSIGARIFGFVALIMFALANSLATASEYPGPGVFDVVRSESEVRVLVYRGGLLGGFGHNHVISTTDIGGRIEIGEHSATSSVWLTIPVAGLEVDIDELRRQEGKPFRKTVSDKDKQGTQKNMLGSKLLDSANFSSIDIRSQHWSGELPDILVKSELTVRGQTNILEIPATVSASDEQIIVTGSFIVTHGQLGLTPFKAILGGLRVREQMEMKFRITARRVSD